MKPSLEREQKLYDALKRISQYDPPERLHKRSECDWGLPADEAIEMAYENVLEEAKSTIRGMKRPAPSVQP